MCENLLYESIMFFKVDARIELRWTSISPTSAFCRTTNGLLCKMLHLLNHKSLHDRITKHEDFCKIIQPTCIVMHFGPLRATAVVVDKTSSNPVPPEKTKRNYFIWFIYPGAGQTLSLWIVTGFCHMGLNNNNYYYKMSISLWIHSLIGHNSNCILSPCNRWWTETLETLSFNVICTPVIVNIDTKTSTSAYTGVFRAVQSKFTYFHSQGLNGGSIILKGPYFILKYTTRKLKLFCQIIILKPNTIVHYGVGKC